MAVCRLWLQKIDKHYTLLYSRKSLGKNLPERISQLSDICTSNEPGYPDRVWLNEKQAHFNISLHWYSDLFTITQLGMVVRKKIIIPLDWAFWIKCGGPAPTTSGSEEDRGGTTSSPGTPTGEKDLGPQEELVITNGRAIEEISFLQVPNDK